MKTVQRYITSISQSGPVSCLELDQSLIPDLQPGQFMMVSGDKDILPVPLFPCGIDGHQYTGAPDAYKDWQPVGLLTIRYPLGKGFSITGSTRRLLMVSGTASPLRLLPAAGVILDRGGEAALYATSIPEVIPPEIEVLNENELPEALAWADGIIGDTALSNLPAWKNLVIAGSILPATKSIQVLVDTPLVCAGTAECGVCAVKTRHGWMRACEDGPVFELSELEV